MKFRRGQTGAPWKVLAFSFGSGVAADGELIEYKDVRLAERSEQKLDSPDILAIKGLGQFKEFIAVSQLRRLIEDWYVSDFHIEEARGIKDAGYSERISASGDNLALVAKYMYDNHRDIFQDGNFKDPFVSRFGSDGTNFAEGSRKTALLCVEEPENQLYPQLLDELAEEFRLYSEEGGQVFISTHSPDFLNAVRLEELFCLIKKDGYTKIYKASENQTIRDLYYAGDLLGQLWRQGLLIEEVDKSAQIKGMRHLRHTEKMYRICPQSANIELLTKLRIQRKNCINYFPNISN